MSDLKRSLSVRKDALMKAYGDLSVLVAEDDLDGVVSERERMKTLYLSFRETYNSHHNTLKEDADIQASDAYFMDVQRQYAAQQMAAKAALKDMLPQKPLKQELNGESESFKTLGHLINLPPLELKRFSGDPDEFDDFVTTFNEVIGNVISDPAAKLIRLKSQVTGIASDSIKMCRTDTGADGYARAMKILRDRFGSPYVVCNSVIQRLIHGPSVRSPSEIRTLADELCNAEITLRKNQMYTEIDTQNNIIQICLRLESSLRYQWRNRVMKNKQSTGVYLNFSDFVSFVQEHADVVNDPLYGYDALEDPSSRHKEKTTVSSLPTSIRDVRDYVPSSNSDASLISNPRSSVQCQLCSKNHKLYTCYKFRSMPIDKRCNYVKSNNLCVLCLSSDHPLSDCRSTYTCKVNNCGEKHSSSLHVYKFQSPAVGNCVISCDKSNVSMPTVPVIIDSTFQTSALLDTGSSVSFCSKRLMNELELQGATMSCQLRTVHGTDNRCGTFLNLQVTSPDGARSLQMNNVLVVDEIPMARYSLDNISSYPHLKGLNFTQCTQVDLLVGQDNSEALVPIEVRRGPVGAPFAVLTMMGWSLNGRVIVDDPCCDVMSAPVPTHNPDAQLNRHEKLTEREGTLGMSEKDQELFVVHGHSQRLVPHEKIKAFVKYNIHINLNKLVIILCAMYSLLCCIIWPYTFGSFSYGCCDAFSLEAYNAPKGGVLLLYILLVALLLIVCAYAL